MFFETGPRPNFFRPQCIGNWLVRSPRRTVRCLLLPLWVWRMQPCLLSQRRSSPASILHIVHNTRVVVNIHVVLAGGDKGLHTRPLPGHENRRGVRDDWRRSGSEWRPSPYLRMVAVGLRARGVRSLHPPSTSSGQASITFGAGSDLAARKGRDGRPRSAPAETVGLEAAAATR